MASKNAGERSKGSRAYKEKKIGIANFVRVQLHLYKQRLKALSTNLTSLAENTILVFHGRDKMPIR